ncbi:MAG: hypothetical protein FJ295_13905 [Planctomycetes bacterium]|nr:hypothetical protein [Planctomycetota bacterium]
MTVKSETSEIDRRQFLYRSLAAASVAGAAPLRPETLAAIEDPPASIELRGGELTAIVGDNSASGEHRTGYNGVWSLRHASSTRNLFVPAVAGLNLEHIVTGEHLDDSKTFFEPRNAPMTLRPIDRSEVELHQPPTPTYQVESWTRFKITPPYYLDMEFRCRAHQPLFPRGYLTLFWASYINAPSDKSIYFQGGLEGQKPPLWTQFCTQFHNDQSTVRHRDDDFVMSFPEGGREALFKNLSRFRFDRPFFYGNFDDLIWLVMFDRASGIRFTHSPSGGGVNADLQTTNPAWDFQFLIPEPEIGKDYRFRIRTALRPACSREEILREVEKWPAAE